MGSYHRTGSHCRLRSNFHLLENSGAERAVRVEETLYGREVILAGLRQMLPPETPRPPDGQEVVRLAA